MRSIHTENSKVSIALNGLYIHEDVLFCRLSFKNSSNINYDIDQFSFISGIRKNQTEQLHRK